MTTTTTSSTTITRYFYSAINNKCQCVALQPIGAGMSCSWSLKYRLAAYSTLKHDNSVTQWCI